MAGLPAPVTPTDVYLAAVHTELVGLREDIKAARRGGEPTPPAPAGTTELLEPKPAWARRSSPRSGS